METVCVQSRAKGSSLILYNQPGLSSTVWQQFQIIMCTAFKWSWVNPCRLCKVRFLSPGNRRTSNLPAASQSKLNRLWEQRVRVVLARGAFVNVQDENVFVKPSYRKPGRQKQKRFSFQVLLQGWDTWGIHCRSSRLLPHSKQEKFCPNNVNQTNNNIITLPSWTRCHNWVLTTREGEREKNKKNNQ